MISLNDITSFDVIIVLLFLLFVIRGTWIGFMRQVAVFLALIGSYLLAGEYTGRMMPYVEQFIENPKAVFFISFGLLFILASIFFLLFGKVLRLVMELSLVAWFDRVLGFMLGMVKGVFVTSFLYMVMSSSVISANELLTKSLTSQYLEHGATFIQKTINDPEMRDLFLPKAPAIESGQPGDGLALPPVGEMFEKIVPDNGDENQDDNQD